VSQQRRSGVGVWLIGGRGSVATTAIAGAAALRSGAVTNTGCVTEQPDFAGVGLPPFDALVFGGHDLTSTPLTKRAEALVQAGVLPTHLPTLVHDDLLVADAEIRHGIQTGRGARPRELIDAVVADLTAFRDRHRLARVVVINVASTEPPLSSDPAVEGLLPLEAALDAGADVLPASSLYAYAALCAGCPVVDFTPSTGMRLPALDELARNRGLPYAGSDGKTGETLVKTALAPLFASRALRVRSWAGTNLLGGGDGATLADPHTQESKVSSKQRAAEEILGYGVNTPMHIDYVPDLGEWKTAWDHVSFEGFLGVRMVMQFTWQGADSALAAPLVLDLARLVARAYEVGESGPLAALAFFFKDPVATQEHRLVAQYDTLRAWARDRLTVPA
jgi:myo-inositol-1-phosphate synthase